MRILILTDDLFPGGVQRHVTDLANRLSERGHSVAVAATIGPFRARLHKEVRFFDVPLARQGRNLSNAVRVAGELIKITRSGDFDILHSHMRYSDVFGRVCALLAGIGHVSTCHSLFEDHRRVSIFGHETIAPSQAVRDMLIAVFGKQADSVTVIYNDPEPLMEPSRRRRRDLRMLHGIEEGESVLFNVSRFTPEKDIATSLRALNILKRKGVKRVKCLLVGYGELYGSILGMIRTYDLEDMVFVLPATSDIGCVIGMSDAGILSSEREGGIPYVVLEAASVGKPVVASATQATMEFIRHGENGLLFSVGDEEGLADCLLQLIQRRALRKQLGRRAQEKYRELRSTAQSIEKTLAVYEKLHNRNGG